MSNLQKLGEEILVVKRETLFKDIAVNGFSAITSFEPWQKLIEQHQEFWPRFLMESDPTFKQIIPYLIFTHDGRYFLMERKATASEQRLRSKKSLGIGGHIRKEDLIEKDIIGWARREFQEEINYQGNLSIEPLGIINDDSDDVGKVHIGFAFLLRGDSANISIKSELKAGELLSLQECLSHYATMETWSQLVVTHLASLEKTSPIVSQPLHQLGN